MTSLQALQRAIEAVGGSQAELARRISTPERQVKPAHIWNWLNRDKKVPGWATLPIERETGVSRFDLCEEVFGKEERKPRRSPERVVRT
jgi:DNA-binding transcriptional regulator YdaS (Cro superfamily)